MDCPLEIAQDDYQKEFDEGEERAAEIEAEFVVLQNEAFHGDEVQDGKGVFHTFLDLTEEKQACDEFQADLLRMANYVHFERSESDKLRLFDRIGKELCDVINGKLNQFAMDIVNGREAA